MRAEKGRPPQWLLIKSRDDAADETTDVTEAYGTSVASGRTIAEIAEADSVWHSDRPADDQPDAVLDPPGTTRAKTKRATTKRAGSGTFKASGNARAKSKAAAVPAFVAPALCQPRAAPPKGDWLAEVKYDGYRGILRAADGAVTILTRSRKGLDTPLPDDCRGGHAAFADRGVMLDGEIVVFDDEGRTSFGALQKAFRPRAPSSADLRRVRPPVRGRRGLRDRPIEERKAQLKALLGKAGGPIVYGDHVAAGKQAALFEQAASLGLEGIIAKRAGSTYRSGRHGGWVKVRAVRSAPFVVGGYTEGGAGRARRARSGAPTRTGSWCRSAASVRASGRRRASDCWPTRPSGAARRRRFRARWRARGSASCGPIWWRGDATSP